MPDFREKIYWFVAAIDSQNAGYRVRTLPLVNGLKERGLDIEIACVNDLAAETANLKENARTVICAKPSTPETYLCLNELKNAGIRIIIDLFDNYFSWSPPLSARQMPLQWLKFLGLADHVFVSTSFLQKVIQKIDTTQVTLIGDPMPATFSTGSAGNGLSKWPAGKTVEILWYGIGSNPYFRAGLDDLLAWKNVLLTLERRLSPDHDIRLTICTNDVPGIAMVLETFRKAGIEAVYQKWSEEICTSLLENSHLALLPTNRTGFSLSKTHNRCSDALVQSCLILCSPNGPYTKIAGAVFSDIDGVCDLLQSADSERVAEQLTQSLDYLAEEYAIPSIIDRLYRTIQSLPSQSEISDERAVVVFGQARGETANTVREIDQTEDFRRYFMAGPLESGVSEMQDFSLTIAESTDDTLDLFLTAPGFNELSGTLNRNIHAEWTNSDSGTGFQVGNFHYSFEGDDRLCRVTSPDFVELVRKIRSLQLIRGKHNTLLGHWFSLHTKLLTLCLSRAGFTNLEFVTHGEAGWSFFAEEFDQPLFDSYQTLNRLWVEYENNELEWGRAGVQ